MILALESGSNIRALIVVCGTTIIHVQVWESGSNDGRVVNILTIGDQDEKPGLVDSGSTPS